jgi:hypothetical protein
VAPKKANWDIKREMQPKLDKLERRTLRAMVEIIQQVGRGGDLTGAARGRRWGRLRAVLAWCGAAAGRD